MIKRAFTILFISLALFSCKNDPCEDVNCNNGTCNDGACVCAPGYEGSNCEVEQRLAFVADYAADESCDLGNFDYQLAITADSPNGTELTISNLGDFGFDVIAIVDGTNLTITEQTDNGRTINGTGQLANGILTIDYVMTTTASQTLTCTVICTPN
jgi:hypothetical protein